MDETKKPWQSKAMWAGVVALIALNAKSLGLVDITLDDQNVLVDILVKTIENGAIIIALVGRYIAKKRIEL